MVPTVVKIQSYSINGRFICFSYNFLCKTEKNMQVENTSAQV